MSFEKARKEKELTVCEKCEIRHYENCGSCFGFGKYKTSGCIVSAGEAMNGELRDDVVACEECRSTEKGVPEGIQ